MSHNTIVWNSTGHSLHTDITAMVYWALKINHLSVCLNNVVVDHCYTAFFVCVDHCFFYSCELDSFKMVLLCVSDEWWGHKSVWHQVHSPDTCRLARRFSSQWQHQPGLPGRSSLALCVSLRQMVKWYLVAFALFSSTRNRNLAGWQDSWISDRVTGCLDLW